MRHTNTISALILYTAAACGVAEVVTPPNHKQGNSSSSAGAADVSAAVGNGGSGGLYSSGSMNGSTGGYSSNGGNGGFSSVGGNNSGGSAGSNAGGSQNSGNGGGAGSQGSSGGAAGFGGSNSGGYGGNLNTGGQGGSGGQGGNYNSTGGNGGFGGTGVGSNGSQASSSASGTGGAGGSCSYLLGTFTTYTQGGWDNHTKILPESLFVNGVLVGEKNSDYALFTKVKAVTDFLPASEMPGALQGQYVDPLTTPAGVLAGQTLTLRLNLLTSNKSCGYTLGDLLVVKGTCKDKNVNEVLDLADHALAGANVSLSYSEINKCVEDINLNFDDGKVDKKYLSWP